MKSIIHFFLITLLCCCQDSNQKNLVHLKASADKQAVVVQMEGKVLGISKTGLEPGLVTMANDSIQYKLWQDGNPLQLHFNLFNTSVLGQDSASYSIPDVNAKNVKVDLNFFDADRNVKSLNKRIIFRKGTISITQLSDSQLRMTFDGEGSGIMEYGKNFPISGEVNIQY